MLNDVVLVSGYWIIAGNRKRGSDSYSELIEVTFKRFSGGQLHFFYDTDKVKNVVKKICQQNNIDLHLYKCSIDSLPFATRVDEFMERLARVEIKVPSGRRDKGRIHMLRDFAVEESPYSSLLKIWLSKVPLTAKIASTQPAGEILVWIDAGFSRFDRNRSNFSWVNASIETRALAAYPSKMTFYGARVRANASLLVAHREYWDHVSQVFTDKAGEFMRWDRLFDEEVVLSELIKDSVISWHKLNNGLRPLNHAKWLLKRIEKK